MLASLNFILLNKLKDDPSWQIETSEGASDSLIPPPINQRKKEKVTACTLWQTTVSPLSPFTLIQVEPTASMAME